MANESIRIRTTPGVDNNIRIKLEQDFDFLEILSLKISQEDLYESFCANYGVVIGRVIANKGFGIPNAKLSIFIPITDEDQKNELIKDLYPFKTPYQKDKEGIRYNLLMSKQTCQLNTPVGTFPTKEEVLDNEIVLEIFEKYYKYTTKTNDAGDFMIFGVPVGQYTLHMDLDMSDIGAASVRPYDLIAEGYPEKLFASKTEFKSSTNLDSLPQIKTGNKGIEVIPFWGDSENCEIGITRADFDTGLEIKPNALFFGSIFTDSGKMSLNKGCNPKNDQGEQDNLKTGEGRIEMIRVSDYNLLDWVNSDKITAIALEEFSIDGGELIDENGTFAYALPMNLGHVITDEFGRLVPSPDPSVGIATKAMYRFKMNFTEPNENPKFRTAHMLFPSLGRDFGGTYGFVNGVNTPGTEDQRFTDDINAYGSLEKDFHLFEWKQLYTIAHYIKKYKKGANRFSFLGIKNTDVSGETNLFPFTTAIWKFDVFYYILAFFIDVITLILKVIIQILSICFYICFQFKIRIKFSVGEFGFDKSASIGFCKQICPFATLGNIFPPLNLTCEGESYQIPPNGSWTSCNPSGCGGATVCNCNVGTLCPISDTDDNGLSIKANLDAGVTGTNTSNNNCLNKLEDWECCMKYQIAENRNVIRRVFTDAWVFGTAYLFQFKYKKNRRGREKFCGPGSDTARGDNYKKNKCCIDEPNGNSCNRCLLRGPNTSKFHQYSGISGYQFTDHNNATTNKKTGAVDINDIIYCNALMSTKIVNLGRVEMCEETLEQIERSIAINSAIQQYLQNPQFYTGTYYEKGWDTEAWVEYMKESSYEDPREVVLFLGKTYGCQLSTMFYNGPLTTFPPVSGLACHEYEIKDNEYNYIKEISKIYTDIALTEDAEVDVFNPTSPYAMLANSPSVDNQNVSPNFPPTSANGGFEVVSDVANRFSPRGGNGNLIKAWNNGNPFGWDLNEYGELSQNPAAFDAYTTPIERNNINTRSNIPYYYFGINPGRTAINRLRRDFFVQK